jgi:N-acetylglucosamine-6-sulfatase
VETAWAWSTMRRAVVASLVLLAMVGTDALLPRVARAAGPRRPDIILIVTDDQRRETFGWMPTIRRWIVERGVRFPRAMVPTPVCCPSRASLLTGQYAHTTGVWSNNNGWTRFKQAGMEARTIAVWLRTSGYRTGLIGKYLNAYHGTRHPPGWSVWHAFLGGNANYYHYELLHTDGSSTRFGAGAAAYSTDVLRRYALQFIAATPSDKPMFLYFAPYAPHEPATPAPRHANLPAPVGTFDPPSFNEADVSDKPPWIQRLPFVSSSFVRDLRVRQYRALRSVDEAVAAMLDAQRAKRRLRNTLLVFLSDNGLMWGEHRVNGKFVPYNGAARIPLAFAWPARVPAGRVDRRLALNIDVPATIAAAAEAPHEDVAGRSLLRRWKRWGFVLEAAGTLVPGPNGTNVQRPPYCGWRTPRFLFTHYGNGREELYDYAHDRWELTDVRGLARYRDRQRSLRRRARVACHPVPPGFSWG